MNEFYRWLEKTENDKIIHTELMAIKDDKKQIEDRFFKELIFGTGGLRGKLGTGTNRMLNMIMLTKKPSV